MQDFGLLQYDPLGGGPLDGPEFLNEPLDIFADPFEDMFEIPGQAASIGGIPLESAGLAAEKVFIEGTGDVIEHLESSIEDQPPLQAEYERDGFDDTAGLLEKSIEGTEIPPADEAEVELFEDVGWGYSMPSVPGAPPPPGMYDNPTARSKPKRDAGPIGQRWGRTNDKTGSDGKIWCPLEDKRIKPEVCEEKSCEYYDPDIRCCNYYSSEEFDNYDDETEESNNKANDLNYNAAEDFEF